MIVNIAISIFGTVANGFVILAYACNPRLRTIQCKIYLLLAITDITVTAFVAPMYVTASLMDLKGNTYCILWAINGISSSFFLELSQAIIVLLRVESYITLAYPYHWRSIISAFRFNSAIVISFLVVSALTVGFYVYDFIFNYIQPCILILEIVVVTVIWCWTYKMIGRHQREIQSRQSSSRSEQISRRKILRSTLTTIAVISSFFVCHFSILSIFIFAKFLNRSTLGINGYALLWSLSITFVYFNSLLNPCLVFWRNSSFRKTVENIFK